MNMTADLHVHTVASGHAYSTILEMAKAAKARGLKVIAVTDHGPAMPGGPHPYYFGNLRSVPDTIGGVRILRGVEANILDPSGSLDLGDACLSGLDFVAAGIHPDTGYSGRNARDNTRAVVNAMQNPHVDMIVHPCSPGYPVDMEQLVMAAAHFGVILELNARSFSPYMIGRRDSWELCTYMGRLARKHGVHVAVNSDAHFSTEVGVVDQALAIARAADLTEEHIICANPARLANFLEKRKTRLRTVPLHTAV